MDLEYGGRGFCWVSAFRLWWKWLLAVCGIYGFYFSSSLFFLTTTTTTRETALDQEEECMTGVG